MTDESVNCIINAADQLAKRKGLIRGLDERFAGPVCGLHAYTDECGREWLLVADQNGISIRQPYSIPQFGNSDAYPSDEFQTAGAVDTNFWTNTDGYEQDGGALILRSGVLDGGDLTWFKAASNQSYEVEITFNMDPESTVKVIIKDSGIARIEGHVVALPLLDANELRADLIWVDSEGISTTILTTAIDLPTGVRTGTATLRYERLIGAADTTFRMTFIVQPEGEEATVQENHTAINALEDSALGQGTSIAITRDLSTVVPKILAVQGGPV